MNKVNEPNRDVSLSLRRFRHRATNLSDIFTT